MKDDKQIFVEWLKYAIKIECKMKGKELAEKLGINPGTISGYITDKSKGPRDIKDRIRICEVLGTDYQKIIDAGRQGVIYTKSETPPTTTHSLPKSVHELDPVTREHKELVKHFVSKHIALETNRKMIELDKSDPSRFADLVSIINRFVKGIDFEEIRAEKQDLKENPQQQGKTGNG